MPACGICILNFKGGVGKTTLSVNFAAGLANTYSKKLDRNFRVLLIDADPQSNASVFMLGEYWKKEIFLKPEKSLYGIMTRILKGNMTKIDESDILGQFSSEERTPVFSKEKKFYEDGKGIYVDSDTYWPNLHIIPAHYSLNNFEKEIRYDEEGRVKIPSISSTIYYYELLDRVGEFIKKYYDFIIVDCPPNIYTMTEIALYFCQNIIIPVIPDWLSTNGINWLLMQVRILKEKFQHKDKIIRAIVPTLWNSKEHVFNRHIRILNKSLGLWKRNPNYSDLLTKAEIWVGLQRLASVSKSIESLRPIVDYQATEPARIQLEMMIKKIANWVEE